MQQTEEHEYESDFEPTSPKKETFHDSEPPSQFRERAHSEIDAIVTDIDIHEDSDFYNAHMQARYTPKLQLSTSDVHVNPRQMAAQTVVLKPSAIAQQQERSVSHKLQSRSVPSLTVQSNIMEEQQVTNTFVVERMSKSASQNRHLSETHDMGIQACQNDMGVQTDVGRRIGVSESRRKQNKVAPERGASEKWATVALRQKIVQMKERQKDMPLLTQLTAIVQDFAESQQSYLKQTQSLHKRWRRKAQTKRFAKTAVVVKRDIEATRARLDLLETLRQQSVQRV